MTPGPNMPAPVQGEVLLYNPPGGKVRVEVFHQSETFWLTRARMAEVFGSSKQAIRYHLRNIFESKELDRAATVKEILTVQKEGGPASRPPDGFYNLAAVIAVGNVSDLESAVKQITAPGRRPRKRKAGK
ncbi:MAG: hypothetical protein IPM24_04650 [Bryobacterales bacterium]|nr:hypothetical protein [Bryobacterales bacterium]